MVIQRIIQKINRHLKGEYMSDLIGKRYDIMGKEFVLLPFTVGQFQDLTKILGEMEIDESGPMLDVFGTIVQNSIGKAMKVIFPNITCHPPSRRVF